MLKGHDLSRSGLRTWSPKIVLGTATSYAENVVWMVPSIESRGEKDEGSGRR